MAIVTRCEVGLFGSSDGLRGRRARVYLYDDTAYLGYIGFYVPEEPIPEDSETDGRVYMHLPSSMQGQAIDLLRNEGPVNDRYSAGCGVLAA